MDEQGGIEMMRRIHENHEHVPVLLQYWDILMIFEAATMTLTHPDMNEYLKTYFTELAKQLEARLAEEFPELQPLLDECWQRSPHMSTDRLVKGKLRRRYR